MGYGNDDRPPLFNPTKYPQKVEVVHPPWNGWDDLQPKTDRNKRKFCAMKIKTGGKETSWLLYEDELDILMEIRPARGAILEVQLREDDGGLSVQETGKASRGGGGGGRQGGTRQPPRAPADADSKSGAIKAVNAYRSFYVIGEVIGINAPDLAAFSATQFIKWDRDGCGEYPTIADFEPVGEPPHEEYGDDDYR